MNYNNNVTSVVIPDIVTSVGKDSFHPEVVPSIVRAGLSGLALAMPVPGHS